MRAIVLIAPAAVMLTVMLLTWGSLGSIVMGFCLGAMAAALLYQHFITNRDEDYFQEE